MNSSFYILELYLAPGGSRQSVLAVSGGLSDVEAAFTSRMAQDDTPFNLAWYGQGCWLSAYEAGERIKTVNLLPYILLTFPEFALEHEVYYEDDDDEEIEEIYRFPSPLLIKFQEDETMLAQDATGQPLILPGDTEYDEEAIQQIFESSEILRNKPAFKVTLLKPFVELMPPLKGELLSEGQEASYFSYYYNENYASRQGVTVEEGGDWYGFGELFGKG